MPRINRQQKSIRKRKRKLSDNTNISTLNDALNLLQSRKKAKLNDTKNKSREYLRKMKINDRIKVLITDKEWESGVVVKIKDDDIIEFKADSHNLDENPIQLSLKDIKWDFEPENFAPPRILNNISQHVNVDNTEKKNSDNNINNDNNVSISDKIINVKDLKCDEIIGYKTIQLLGWEPVISNMKMGKISFIDDTFITINGQKIEKTQLHEIYQVVPKNKKLDKRRKRRQKQKEKKKLARNTFVK